MPFPLIPAVMALAQFVPAISRWVSGDNAGGIAETIATVAQTVTGSKTIEEAITRIQTEPDKQRAFQLAMQERSDELEKAYLLDRQSARSRDTQIQVVTGRNRRGDILAYGAVAMLLACIIGAFFMEIPATSRDIVLMLIGGLLVIVKDVYGFEFGTSKDSARTAAAFTDYVKRSNGR